LFNSSGVLNKHLNYKLIVKILGIYY